MEDDPMPSINDQLSEIYVLIDDYLKQHPEKAQWRDSNHDEPAFSDAEVLTIGLSQGAFGVQSLKEAYHQIRDHHRAAFPHLPSYKQWLARLHPLNPLVSDLLIASTATLEQSVKTLLDRLQADPSLPSAPPRPRAAEARGRSLLPQPQASL